MLIKLEVSPTITLLLWRGSIITVLAAKFKNVHRGRSEGWSVVVRDSVLNL